MTRDRADDLYRRRRLRLGALLFRLRYYMQTPDDIAANLYRLDSLTYVQVDGEAARFVADGHVEVLSLAEAIERCKAALAGAPLHRGDAG